MPIPTEYQQTIFPIGIPLSPKPHIMLSQIYEMLILHRCNFKHAIKMFTGKQDPFSFAFFRSYSFLVIFNVHLVFVPPLDLGMILLKGLMIGISAKKSRVLWTEQKIFGVGVPPN